MTLIASAMRDNLLPAAKLAARAAATSRSDPFSGLVGVRSDDAGLTLLSRSDQVISRVWAPARITRDGSCVVQAGPFLEAVRTARADERLDLELRVDALLVTAGSRTTALPLGPVAIGRLGGDPSF